MSAAIVLVLLLVTVVVFASERADIGVFSLVVMITLVVTRVLRPEEVFVGLANSAVIMIAGIMIVTGGLTYNGGLEMFTSRIAFGAGRSDRRAAAMLLGCVNLASSVINNVAATALCIPLAEGVAKRFSTSRARYLMPVAFASMTGGMCTLIGTSTNVAVSGALEQRGLRPLSMFELTPIGVLVALAGLVYLLWIAPLLLRQPTEKGPVEEYGIKEFLYELAVRPGGPFDGRTLGETNLEKRHSLIVLAVESGERRVAAPGSDQVLRGGDVLLVESSVEGIGAVLVSRGLEIRSKSHEHAPPMVSREGRFVEATVSFSSPLIGKTLQEAKFRQGSGLTVIAIHRREERLVEKVGKIPIRGGDVLLIYGREERIQQLVRESPSLVLVESAMLSRYDQRRTLISALVLVGAVICSSVGWLDAPTTFLAGGTLVLALRCLPAERLAEFVNVRLLVMVAAMSAMGTAMEVSGAADWLAHGLRAIVPGDHPLLLMAAFFVLTVVLTQPLSNAAAALVVLPIALKAAGDLGVDARPFAIAVTIAASCSFVSPLEPACLLVYSRGSYRFLDFTRVGTPLTLVVFVISMLLVPRLWPFSP